MLLFARYGVSSCYFVILDIKFKMLSIHIVELNSSYFHANQIDISLVGTMLYTYTYYFLYIFIYYIYINMYI